ncbi:MAG: hypothetical protein WBD25_03905, partial [Terriglobales bacterium]
MQHSEDAVAERCVAYQIGVEASDSEVRLGHGNLHAANQAREHRKATHHFSQQLRVSSTPFSKAVESIA